MPFPGNLPPLPTAAEMREWDHNAIEFGIPELMLMENAGLALFNFMKDKFSPLEDKNFLLFMGGGNNGGDAACLGRHLNDAGARTLVISIKDPARLPPAAARHYELARSDGVNFKILEDYPADFPNLQAICREAQSARPDCIIDGLLGTGFNGELKKDLNRLIIAINELASYCQIPVMAIDTPSGLNCENGLPQPTAIQANWTICLAAAKKGLVLPCAKPWTGELFVRSIGMPRSIKKPCSCFLVDSRLTDEASFPDNAFKNSYGHVLIIGGSFGLTGAPALSALAALREGAGLVSVCAPEALLKEIKDSRPEIMSRPVGNAKESQWPDKISAELAETIPSMQSLVIGPGMGRSEEAGIFLKELLSLPNRPAAVIDADALFHLAAHREMLEKLRPCDILTPHPGEAARLLGISGKQVQENREGSLARLCELASPVFVLKGASTLICQKDSPLLLAPYDVPQMSIAGAGDVLSGCLGALLANPFAKSMTTLEIAAKGVMTHIMAGMICAEKYPGRGALASDLANALACAKTWPGKNHVNFSSKGFSPVP